MIFLKTNAFTRFFSICYFNTNFTKIKKKLVSRIHCSHIITIVFRILMFSFIEKLITCFAIILFNVLTIMSMVFLIKYLAFITSIPLSYFNQVSI